MPCSFASSSPETSFCNLTISVLETATIFLVQKMNGGPRRARYNKKRLTLKFVIGVLIVATPNTAVG